MLKSVLKKLKMKNELKLIQKKLNFLTEEAINRQATIADIAYWCVLLDRLKELKNNKVVKNIDDIYKYYDDIYTKYVLDKI